MGHFIIKQFIWEQSLSWFKKNIDVFNNLLRIIQNTYRGVSATSGDLQGQRDHSLGHVYWRWHNVLPWGWSQWWSWLETQWQANVVPFINKHKLLGYFSYVVRPSFGKLSGVWTHITTYFVIIRLSCAIVIVFILCNLTDIKLFCSSVQNISI